MRVYKKGTLVVIKPGDTITDFRGELSTFVAIDKEPSPGKSGKLRTSKGVYYPHVFDLEIR